MYAWTITEDHLYTDDPDFWKGIGVDSSVGVQGPHDAPDELLRRLDAGEGHVFRMYDDDGIKYYTGRALADADSEESEEFCAGPLDDYGRPNAGAVLIKWQGHPEWEVG